MSILCIDKSEGRQSVRVFVKKWGNSASVRIPAAVMQAANFRLDQQIEVREDGGRVILEPIAPEACDIEALVACITDDNLHDNLDTGPPVGNEVW